MNCKIKPMSHRIIVAEKPASEKIKGIVMIQRTVEESQAGRTEGKVLCMASDAFDYLDEKDRPKVGDVVHFIKYDGIGKEYNKINYRIVMDESVWGISKEYISKDEDLIDAEEKAS